MTEAAEQQRSHEGFRGSMSEFGGSRPKSTWKGAVDTNNGERAETCPAPYKILNSL